MERKAWARSWRPQSFSEVCGHQEVIKAIQSSLSTGRLHHAYLLTGTRGVGKTTIARLLAKSLNCEQGVVAEPCNQCSRCDAISRGDFADVLEIDAASRTRVEETRELLENVPFRPIEGRYKVYVIDEVHMLSMHSFNALLKTLEEPPEHVKFILATTDPQKLPATIVSRCLRFHLKSLSTDDIAQQLEKVLDAESVSFESNAVQMVAEAGQGSLRDALSLLEQVAMLSSNQLTESDVAEALGLVPTAMFLKFFRLLASQQFEHIPAWLKEVHASGANYKALLKRLVGLVHEVCMYQVMGTVLQAPNLPEKELQKLCDSVSATDLQLLYEALLKGIDDLARAPSEQLAFEMAILRGLFFVKATSTPIQTTNKSRSSSPEQAVQHKAPSAPEKKMDNALANKTNLKTEQPLSKPTRSSVPQGKLTEDSWRDMAKKIPAQGISKMVLLETCLGSFDGKRLTLEMGKRSLPMISAQVKQDLKQKISMFLGQEVQLDFVAGEANKKTPRDDIEEEKARQKKANQEKFETNPAIKEAMQELNGKLDPDSIRQV